MSLAVLGLKPLPADQLYGFLQAVKQSDPEQFIALHADQDVPYGKIVDILDKGSKVGIKVVLATKPASDNYASPEPEPEPQVDGASNVTEIPAGRPAPEVNQQPEPVTTVTVH